MFVSTSTIALFVFWLPPDSGEKITLTITILLALIVFLQFITEYTPKAAKTLPIIGLYFNINLILVLVSVLLTILVLNFHFRGPKKQRVPRWMRKYIIGYLGKAFCFCYESSAFQKAQEENQQIIESIANTGGSKESSHLDPVGPNTTFSVKPVKSQTRDRGFKGCGIDVACNQIQQLNRTSTSSSDDEFEKQLEPAYCKVSKIERKRCYHREDQRVSDYTNNNNETDHFLSR